MQENPLWKGPTSNYAIKYHTLQEKMDSYWAGAYQSVSASLCQTFATEEFTLKKPTDQKTQTTI